MDNPIRTLIVDDDALFCQAIRTLLENTDGMMAIGEAKDGQKATALARALQPDVILLNVDTLPSDSLQTVARIHELSPGSKMIMLGAHGQEHLVLDAFRKGAHGHLVKGKSTPPEIVEAIRAVSRGDAILSPRMAGWIFDEMACQRRCQMEPRERRQQARI